MIYYIAKELRKCVLHSRTWCGVTWTLELLTHRDLFPKIRLQLAFIAENCQQLVTVLT